MLVRSGLGGNVTRKAKCTLAIIALLAMVADNVLDMIFSVPPYMTVALIILMGAFAVILGASGYRWWQRKREETAQRRKPRRSVPQKPIEYWHKPE